MLLIFIFLILLKVKAYLLHVTHHVRVSDIKELTHIFPVDFSILINWTSQCPNLGVSGVLFHIYFISNRNSCKQTV